MTRRSKIWLVVAVLFTLANLGGAVFAAMQKELLHTLIHVGLLLLGAYLVWLIATRSGTGHVWHRQASPDPALTRELGERLTRLEQSVDAVAIEVERIGEGQRFLTRRFAGNGPPQPAGEGAAEANADETRRSAPDDRHR